MFQIQKSIPFCEQAIDWMLGKQTHRDSNPPLFGTA